MIVSQALSAVRKELQRRGSIYYAAALVMMFVCYVVRVVTDEKVGADLRLRIAEATYFLKGINPYEVFVGHVKRIDGVDVSHAYSFFSYYFAAIFIPIQSTYVQALLFVSLDLLALYAGIWLLGRITGTAVKLSAPLVIAILLFSVFFWQHINNLNYNFTAALGLLVAFYGITRASPSLTAVGMVVVGLKPSLAIPALLYLLISSRWRAFFYSGLAYAALLMLTCWQIDTNPIDIIVQLAIVQEKFSNGYTDGFFFFLKPFLNGHMTALGIIVSVTVLILCRRYLIDPANGLIVVIALGLSFFYNNVHAWLIVYPILAYAMAEWLQGKADLTPCVLLTIFLVLPRFAGLIDEKHVEAYVAIHNVVRFSLLMVATFLLVRFRVLNVDRLTRQSAGFKA